MSADLTMEALAALRKLYTLCVWMDHKVESKRPTEAQRQEALAQADAVLATTPAKIAIVDRVAFGVALRRNDLNACIAIARRHGLEGWSNETVMVGLDAAARGQDMNAAIEVHLYGEAAA